MSLQSSESEKDVSNKTLQNETIIELQLGDVIQISNPLNETLNDQIFIIDYIDKSKAYLINTDTLEKTKVKISEDGVIGDGNITRIAVLSRSDTPSYAKQHDLLPNKWVNIYFGGDYPVIITGEITNLEEDMIEVKTSDGDTLYINFDYKGIPEDLPIDYFEIRDKPQEAIKETEQSIEEVPEIEGLQEDVEEKEHRFIDTEKIQISVPTKNIKDQLREFIIKADQIKFGDEELGPIVQYVDVSSKFQRYSLETQVSDLLDELLSTIPSSQRTASVLNNIHIVIERFKQLRENFSFFDQYGNVEGAVVKEATYKPLIKYFGSFKQNLFWLLPVVKNIKKVYNVDNLDEENTDVVNIELGNDLDKINELIENYKANTLPTDQNKYSALYSELDPFFTPFYLINDENTSNVIIEKKTKSDINVIIDNLEDMYSSVFNNNNIRTRRFVIQKYNMGLTKLDTLDSTSSKLITTRVNMTNSDTLSIKSFVTLPEPAIRFSKINLPGTNMLERANLNLIFLNYWQFLKQKTAVNPIFVEDLNKEIDFNENNFVNNVKNYILNLGDNQVKGITKQEIYNKFIETIVPKTKILFELVKKYINGKLSIVDVVGYLEPFLVYTDDLTYQQYVQIIEFIDSEISKYNKNFIDKSRLFMSLSKIKSTPVISSNAYSIITILSKDNEENDMRLDVFTSGYDINANNAIHTGEFTNSEILRKLMIKDCSRLYTTALSLKNVPLMFPNELSSILNSEKINLDKKAKEEEKDDKCKTMTIAKMYNSLEALNDDNDKTIYFDKKYDKTNYGMLDADYSKEIITMNPEDLKIHIANDLINKKNLSEIDADYLSNTLLDGHKKVMDGQYAILYKGYNEDINKEVDYYVRKHNKWSLDDEMSGKINTDESSLLCDLQEKCINVPDKVDDKCVSIHSDELGIQNKLLKDVINEFDTKYKISKEEFSKEIKEKFEYFLGIIGIITKIETVNMLKYNNQKYKLGSTLEDDIDIKAVSPNLKLLNLILKQKDFVKKQHDIVRFVNTYTSTKSRIAFDNSTEEDHWLYCLKTDTPLLPKFKFELACSYVTNPNGYKDFLEIVKSKIGKLSDDGDWWCDENSGWPICPVDFDIEEGYEDGFKVSTRSILEDEAGNKIVSVTKESIIKYDTPDTIMINNIVNAMSVAMGINIEIQKEFIMNCVLSSLRNTLESENDYKNKVKEMAQKGKKIASYKDFYNTAILYYTLGMFLISVQTVIPSVKTRKTHPGCVRSFSGYPFEGAGDLSSLNYIGCVAYDIRESGEPWNVLKGKKMDVILNKIKGSIDSVLLEIPDVKRMFDEKTEYLLTNPASEIPQEHDIAKWKHFLPPLFPFTIKNLVNVSDEFKKGLINDLRSGSEKQREKLLVIDSKIIQFSLAIQERIQEVVKKHKLILHTSNNDPYLENACCESQEGETTIGYFVKEDPRILEYNETVSRLTNILSDITFYSKSGLFYSNVNTKNKYPPLSNQFDEKTIYLSFIYFCKFKSLMPIPTDFLPFCSDKPDSTLINPNDSIDRIIQKLKDDGRNYSNDQFLRLLQLVSRNNVINIDFNTPEISSITKFVGTLESIDMENDEVVERSLRDLITNALDTFDIASEDTTKEIKDLNNFLIKNIESMKSELIEFIGNNNGPNITKSSVKKAQAYILNISNWVADESTRNEDIKISNDKLYGIVNFYRTFIENFVTIFPNIILNQVDYNDVLIPNYLGFSLNHSKKLKKYINSYYEKLKTFYGLPSVTNVLTTIQKTSRNLVKMAKETPCFSSIKTSERELKPVLDERTSRFLYEYYLLRTLINYIELADEDDMIVTEVSKNVDVTDLFSVDYLEERETRVDFTMSNRNEKDTRLLTGNKKELRQKVTQLLIAFIDIMNNQKDTIDISYEEIQDRVFKLREKEKDMVTDRLKNLTDETRDIDTILKINKLGMYSKGLQKGLTTLDKDFYDQERDFRDEMASAEKIIRKKNKNVTDENIDQLVEDYLDERENDREIDEEANDMSYMNDDFFDGNTDGVGSPEEEEQDYDNYN